MDYIDLTALKFTGYHGCLPAERVQGQIFLVDARLGLDLSLAGTTDDLSHTVNYAAVYTDIKDIVTGEPKNLIESVAETIATTLLQKYPLQQVTITIHKPHAPIAGAFTDISVSITRKKS